MRDGNRIGETLVPVAETTPAPARKPPRDLVRDMVAASKPRDQSPQRGGHDGEGT